MRTAPRISPTSRPARRTLSPTRNAPVVARVTRTVRPGPSARSDNSRTHTMAQPSATTSAAPAMRRASRPESSNGGPRLTRSFLPEKLPRIAFQIAHQLLQVVVDLRIDEQRAGGAFTFFD